MDYYNNAMGWYKSAKFAITGGFYQQSISQSCLAVELFLKSKLLVTDPNSELDKSHDCLNIFYVLLRKYPTKKDLLQGIRNCRKYFNESRYPYGGVIIYTEEFATQFIGYVEAVKDYIDNDCQSSLEDLQYKFSRNNP